MLKLAPEQHQELNEAALRAKLEQKPHADEGASYVVRTLVQGWIDEGSEWPG